MRSKQSILQKLELLRKYVGYLKEYQRYALEDLQKNYTLRGAVERYFQLAIECVIDIAEIIISDLKIERPGEYREAIDLLGEKGILPGDFAYYFAPIAGFRNILVHEYIKVDLKEVYRHLKKDLPDFDKFARYIADYLSERNP